MINEQSTLEEIIQFLVDNRFIIHLQNEASDKHYLFARLTGWEHPDSEFIERSDNAKEALYGAYQWYLKYDQDIKKFMNALKGNADV